MAVVPQVNIYRKEKRFVLLLFFLISVVLVVVNIYCKRSAPPLHWILSLQATHTQTIDPHFGDEQQIFFPFFFSFG